MYKKPIFFIFIWLCSANIYLFSASIGIKNSYLNDKFFYKTRLDGAVKEDIKDYDIYIIGPIYKLQMLNLYFETYFNYGWGSTKDTFVKNLEIHEIEKHFKSKEKIIEYDFKLSYLYNLGPLGFGPIFEFNYNRQSIHNLFDVDYYKFMKFQWYLPSAGIFLKLYPMVWKAWHLFSLYDFSFGRVKVDREKKDCAYYQALRHHLTIGTVFEIFKWVETEINFSYLSYRSNYKSRDLKKLSRESFEGSLILSFKF